MVNESDNEKNEANEPQSGYGKSIVFFKSFEEMNEYNHQYFSSLSYEQRLAQLNFMLKHFYAKELSENKSLGTKIYFD